MGFEPTIPVFERAKAVYALDLAATVIDIYESYRPAKTVQIKQFDRFL
jgi:hypothetical protein